jgi:hypothetical protein
MQKINVGTPKCLAQWVVLVLLNLVVAGAIAMDPTKTVGSDECIDCHTPEHDVLGETTHSKTYDELSGGDKATEIADALGLDDIEAPDGTCVGCHFTLVGDTVEDAEPIAGISCESCHGPAADWIEVHGEYLSGDAASETPAEKATRKNAAKSAGQIRPDQINLIAANCLSCHTVPNEELVNTGGHLAGSDFELVSWSQGEVRHNLFWNDGEENVQASPERKRVLYVVGLATDLEFSLRALGKSSEAGTYRDAMSARVKKATAGLKAVNGKINSPDISKALAAAGGINVGTAPDQAKINGAADKIQAAIVAFIGSHNGSKLAAIDAMIPTGDGHYSEKY